MPSILNFPIALSFVVIGSFLTACSSEIDPNSKLRTWTPSESELQRASSIYEIDISGQDVEAVSEKIAILNSLEYIYMDNNSLKKLPKSMKKLKSLNELSIAGNKLQNDIPDVIGELTQLTKLDLSENELQELPSEILQLKNLEVLDLRYNQLSDLPEPLKKLENLKTVYIGNNDFDKETRKKFRKWMPRVSFVWLGKKKPALTASENG
ncbi:MAG: leucine-rich repeat domain-containing protein [Saprospiraceae bacterium]|nr:leucine-rich repeat domain-containing protein [Saprospiraceae bacterium]